MIQTRSTILIKDNSGLLKARTVQGMTVGKQPAKVGSVVTAVITKTSGLKTHGYSSKKNYTSAIKSLQKLLIIMTRSKFVRYDGSSIAGPKNYGVLLNVKVSKANKKVVDLGFKRIHSFVPFELKSKYAKTPGLNLLKLAKGRL